ncbi:GldG family protein [Candidatus Parcubacteria bacterium]|nr:GldG family protein [Candidatus Parcubacteria bacterium]
MASQKSFYFDLTEEKIYTTSEATRNILKNLEEKVEVNFYISKDLPQDVAGVKTQLIDFMNQYQDIAGASLKVSYLEPENTPEKVRELAEKGIPQIQFNVIEKDKYEVKQGFFGVEITSESENGIKREAIPIIQSIDSWEYDFISAVFSVSQEKKELVAFLQGHGEKILQIPDLIKSYDILEVKIESAEEQKGFYVEKTMSSEEDTEEATKTFVYPITLIIAGPMMEISTEEISVLDDFIRNGGNLIVLSEAVNPNLQGNLEAQLVENNLNELTKKYGIEINNNLVYDKSNFNITYQQGFFSVSKPYPFWLKLVSENFGDHPALSNIQSIMFPWASSLTLSENNDYFVRSILSSTNQGETASENYNLLPDGYLSFASGSKKTVAAVSQPKNENSKSGSLFVIGDSDFVSSNFIRQVPDNEIFFVNLIDSVSNSANLASIRSKNIVDRPIKDLEESEKNYWKFVAIFAGAILIDVYGIFRIMKRRKSSR